MRIFKCLMAVAISCIVFSESRGQSVHGFQDHVANRVIYAKNAHTAGSELNVPLYRKWWQIALADAAGALGGVASGNQLCKHWLCAVVGGIIGAAGASVSVARMSGAIPVRHPQDVPISFQNKYELIGNLHNSIIRDYLNENHDPGPLDLYDYILLNRDKYGLNETPISKEVYNTIVAGSLILNTADEAIEHLRKLIPSGNKNVNEFLLAVKQLLETEELTEFNHRSIEVEENFFKKYVMSESETMLYESFFSTFRHSANLWN